MERSDEVGGSAPKRDRGSAPSADESDAWVLGGSSEKAVHRRPGGASVGAAGSAGSQLAAAVLDQLVLVTIRTRADLAAAEQVNIDAARRWAFGPEPVIAPEELLTIEGADEIHRRMFGDVWRHAGQHCAGRTETGVEPHWISHRLESVFDDARFWHRVGLHSPEYRAERLYRRLLDVQAYEVGSVAHARFVADLYLHLVGDPSEDPTGSGEVPHDGSGGDPRALREALDRATRMTELRRRFGWPG